MRYSALGGGKRIRPCSSTRPARRSARRSRRARCARPAPSNSSTPTRLVHDDLPAMDDDDLRRGRPTCHRAFDEATAILVGRCAAGARIRAARAAAGIAQRRRRRARACVQTARRRRAAPPAWRADRRIDLAAVGQHADAGRDRAHARAQDRRADPAQRAARRACAAELRAQPIARALDEFGARDRPRVPDPGRHPRRRRRRRRARQARPAPIAPATSRPIHPSSASRPRAPAHARAASRALAALAPLGSRSAPLATFPTGWRARTVLSFAVVRVDFTRHGLRNAVPAALARSTRPPICARSRRRSSAQLCGRAARVPDPHRRHDAAATSPPASARSSSPSRCTMSSTRRTTAWSGTSVTRPIRTRC